MSELGNFKVISCMSVSISASCEVDIVVVSADLLQQ